MIGAAAAAFYHQFILRAAEQTLKLISLIIFGHGKRLGCEREWTTGGERLQGSASRTIFRHGGA
jgi:hypothetical protein